MKRYYVYEWFNKSNNYIFYVGKGCGNRCSRIQGRNKTFLKYIEENGYTKSKSINTVYCNIWENSKNNKTYLGFYFKY